MEIVKNESDLPVLYGVYSDKTSEGVIGFLVDASDGSVAIRANCEDPEHVRVVFGFDELPEDVNPDLIADISAIKGALDKMLPDGYQMEWIGWWRDDPRTVALCPWMDGLQLQRDDKFDYIVPDRIVEANVAEAKNYNYQYNPQFWDADKSRDFYLGFQGAVRVIATLIPNCKNQKELLERVNKMSLDSMILIDKKKNKLIL